MMHFRLALSLSDSSNERELVSPFFIVQHPLLRFVFSLSEAAKLEKNVDH